MRSEQHLPLPLVGAAPWATVPTLTVSEGEITIVNTSPGFGRGGFTHGELHFVYATPCKLGTFRLIRILDQYKVRQLPVNVLPGLKTIVDLQGVTGDQ